jgi:hypothetical protein
MAWDRPLAPFAGLHFFEGVGERADRARQHEQATAELRRKTKLGVDHAGRAVDVHRDRTAGVFRKLRLDRAADGGKAPADRAGLRRSIDQFQQTRRARIERMEAVPEARHMANALLLQRRDFGRHGRCHALVVG